MSNTENLNLINKEIKNLEYLNKKSPNFYERNLRILLNTNQLLINSNISKVTNYNYQNQKSIILNPLEFLKSLVQLTRLIQFLKTRPSLRIVIDSDNLELNDIFPRIVKSNQRLEFHIISKIIKKLNPKNYINKPRPKYISRRVWDQMVLRSKAVQLYFHISSTSLEKNYFKYVFSKNLFLIYVINSSLSLNNLNTYTFYNNIDDTCKIIFLLLFLKKNLKS